MTEKQTTAVVPHKAPSDLMPAMTIQEALERKRLFAEYVKSVLIPGTDYGAIPGTDKPTLLKPGAEKLSTLFNLSPRFEYVERTEDWSGKDHGGEPFFYYLVKCRLFRNDKLAAEGDGSCNSWESRYRWRKADRKCPACGKAAIIKGREEYGGGWVCFKKKDGCGAKFRDGDKDIESQPSGKVKNADPADLVNTVCKMAHKRSYVAAVLLATNASEFFTADVEDLADTHPDAEVAGIPTEEEKQMARQSRMLTEAFMARLARATCRFDVEAAGTDIKDQEKALLPADLAALREEFSRRRKAFPKPEKPTNGAKPGGAPAASAPRMAQDDQIRHIARLAQQAGKDANAVANWLNGEWGVMIAQDLTESQADEAMELLREMVQDGAEVEA